MRPCCIGRSSFPRSNRATAPVSPARKRQSSYRRCVHCELPLQRTLCCRTELHLSKDRYANTYRSSRRPLREQAFPNYRPCDERKNCADAVEQTKKPTASQNSSCVSATQTACADRHIRARQRKIQLCLDMDQFCGFVSLTQTLV